MNTVETKVWDGEVDRAGWGDGPWNGEPDRMQWTDAPTGLPCLAVRQKDRGHWCGYVGLPAGHPWRGEPTVFGDIDIEVHGGITYGPEVCQIDGRVCHETSGDDDVMWIGFDCAHAWDLSPSWRRDCDRFQSAIWAPHGDETYKTLDYVRAQCRRLAEQVARAAT